MYDMIAKRMTLLKKLKVRIDEKLMKILVFCMYLKACK